MFCLWLLFGNFLWSDTPDMIFWYLLQENRLFPHAKTLRNLRRGCVSPKDVLQTVCDATAKAAKAAGITVRIILCEIVGCAGENRCQRKVYICFEKRRRWASAEPFSEFVWHKKFDFLKTLCAAEWSMELAHMCKDFAAQGVVGIDIAGCGGSDGTEFLPYKEAFEVLR